jgi:hypothetical protein
VITSGYAARFYGGMLYAEPTWRKHSEFYESPRQAHDVFRHRFSVDGGRRVPPKLIRWNSNGEPLLTEQTLAWNWPAVDDQAWMEIVHLPGVHLDLIEASIYPTVKLIVRRGLVVPEGSPA